MAMEKDSLKTIAQNKKAFHDYFVLESIEAGIELCGTEVKSVRGGQVNLKDAWCDVKNGEMLVHGMHISPYDHGNIFNRDPMRTRRLLLQITNLKIITSKLYFNFLNSLNIKKHFHYFT